MPTAATTSTLIPLPQFMNASTSSVRRNLFHAHLSRRPGSSTSASSDATATTSNTNMASRPTSSRTTASSRPTSSRSQLNAKPASRLPTSDNNNSTSNSTEDLFASAGSVTITTANNDIVPRDPKTGAYLGVSLLPSLPVHLPFSHSQHHHDGPSDHSDPTTAAGATAAAGPKDPTTDPSAFYLSSFSDLSAQDTKDRFDKMVQEMLYLHRAKLRSRNAYGGTKTGGGTAAGSRAGAVQGLGAEMEEVMDLLRQSLRARALEIEEEGWMYGDEGEGFEGEEAGMR